MKKTLLVVNGPAYGADETFIAVRLDARGLTKEHLIEEAPRSSMDELATWTVEADQVLTF